jgi:hypothetical protein
VCVGYVGFFLLIGGRFDGHEHKVVERTGLVHSIMERWIL